MISGYSTPTVYRPAQGPPQILVPESFQLSAYAVADGRRLWWVRGLACEMKSVLSIQGDVAYVNGWGFPQNQAGSQVPTVPFADGLAKYDVNKDGRIAADEITGTAPMDRMLSSKVGFPAFDLDGNGARRQRVGGVPRHARVRERPAAIALGGEGDMTARAVSGAISAPCRRCRRRCSTRASSSWSTTAASSSPSIPPPVPCSEQGRLKGAMDK